MSLQLLMDGTASKKDLVHGTTATTVGTAGYTTMLGVSAPNVGEVDGDTFFTSYYFPVASLGLAAAQKITVVIALRAGWAGNDGVYHAFISTITVAGGGNGFRVHKSNGNNLTLIVYSNGASKYKYMAVDATNMPADQSHLIIATIDESNNQGLYLNGTAATLTSGTSNREVSLGTNVYVGTDYNLTSPINASEVVAAFDRILTPLERTRVFDIRNKWNSWLSPSFEKELRRLGGTIISAPTGDLRGIDELHKYAGNG